MKHVWRPAPDTNFTNVLSLITFYRRELKDERLLIVSRFLSFLSRVLHKDSAIRIILIKLCKVECWIKDIGLIYLT